MNSLTLVGVVRRILNVSLAIALLALVSPIILTVALLVRLTLGRPVLFRQVRAGMHGKPFVMFKFRTMRDLCDGDGKLLPDHLRLTRFGRFLRSASLDELPELVNVVRGEMSLVGPRPLLMEYLERYTPEQFRRHDVKPGITGWAQVNGRNELSWDRRFEYDVWYVDHQSLWLDVKILCLTVARVLQRSGIAADGHATMPLFTGNRSVITPAPSGRAPAVLSGEPERQAQTGAEPVPITVRMDRARRAS